MKPTPGSQLALFASYSYHGFITDRDGEMLELEADHRRHAEIENAIRDLKHGVGLNHLPSGRFAANAAWLAVQVMAHNLARWTARIGLGEQVVVHIIEELESTPITFRITYPKDLPVGPGPSITSFGVTHKPAKIVGRTFLGFKRSPDAVPVDIMISRDYDNP